ncbi:MAG: glycosyltransferase family 2 protein [Planctomycetes bacterium]|nr:glycosyltransferase family 2 protein [Planctomycetota bacterium]
MSQRPTITAAIIAMNEARNLAELLPKLDWVDEILVVDGGSADATVAVAQGYGCRVSTRPFDTFARQRNHALDLATGEWVLSVDADERPTPRLAAEIRRATRSARNAAYRIPIRSSIFGRTFRASGTQDDRPVRLIRRGAARWHGSVHERLRVSGRVGQLEGWLRHQTYPDLHAFLVKMNRYTTLEVRARVESGRRPRRRDAWILPAREVFRRLVWKRGFLDGPEGWGFALLSGLSEWVTADRHRRLWAVAGPKTRT